MTVIVAQSVFDSNNASGPEAAVNAAHDSKLLRDYHPSVNSWPNVVLLLGVFGTSGRAHSHSIRDE